MIAGGDDYTIDKLTILFVAERVEAPLLNDTLTDICTSNNWVQYMQCKQCIADLIDAKFLVNVSRNNTPLYVISAEGRECLSALYSKIPASRREEIKQHIEKNIDSYRRRQEYVATYNQNADGSYTVLLKITGSSPQPVLELKLNVQNRNTAKWIHSQWVDKAPEVYEHIYDVLLL